jgi:hypothetical protein
VFRRPILALLGAGALTLASLGATAGASTAASTAPAAGTSSQEQNPLSDQGSSPNYRSLITSLSPASAGVSVQVLQFSDRLLLRNHSGRTVVIYGYQGEQYARVLANGTVQVNTRSPAYYLNQSFYGNVTVPSSASPTAAPHWSVVDRTGQFEWHDHRIHWMSPLLPPQVKDKAKRTLIFNWQVPIAVGASKGSLNGQLFWTPESSSAPVAAIVVGVVIVLLGLLLVFVVHRRRGTGLAGPGPEAPGGSSTPPPEPPADREAW